MSLELPRWQLRLEFCSERPCEYRTCAVCVFPGSGLGVGWQTPFLLCWERLRSRVCAVWQADQRLLGSMRLIESSLIIMPYSVACLCYNDTQSDGGWREGVVWRLRMFAPFAWKMYRCVLILMRNRLDIGQPSLRTRWGYMGVMLAWPTRCYEACSKQCLHHCVRKRKRCSVYQVYLVEDKCFAVHRDSAYAHRGCPYLLTDRCVAPFVSLAFVLRICSYVLHFLFEHGKIGSVIVG